MLKYLLDRFDKELRDTLEHIVGGGLTEKQWDQATLGVKLGGLGVRSISEIADAAYIASRAATYENCKRGRRSLVNGWQGLCLGTICS